VHRPIHVDGTPFDILVLTPDEARERARYAALAYRTALEDARRWSPDGELVHRELADQAA
jgi:hypothetical protein